MCPDIFISTLLKVFESIFGIFRIKDEFSFSLRTLQCILTYLIKGETSQEEEIISQTDDGIYTHKSKYLSLLAYTLFPSFLPFLHIHIHLLLSLSHTHTYIHTLSLTHTRTHNFCPSNSSSPPHTSTYFPPLSLTFPHDF